LFATLDYESMLLKASVDLKKFGCLLRMFLY